MKKFNQFYQQFQVKSNHMFKQVSSKEENWLILNALFGQSICHCVPHQSNLEMPFFFFFFPKNRNRVTQLFGFKYKGSSFM